MPRRQPDPDRIAEYQARLADLVARRDLMRAERNHHRVKLLNRQIRAQLKWIERGRRLAGSRSARPGG